jgi:membrane-bound ClpP family serine protease
MDQQPLKPGWSRPKPAVLPRPTYWPVIMALGITFLAWGIVTTWITAVLGTVLFVLSLVGWIGDIRNEPQREESESE